MSTVKEARVVVMPALGYKNPDNLRHSSPPSKPVYFLAPGTNPKTTDFTPLAGFDVLLVCSAALNDAKADMLAEAMLCAGASVVRAMFFAEGPLADEWEPAGLVVYRDCFSVRAA